MLDDHSSQYRGLVLESLISLGPIAKGATPKVTSVLKQKLTLTPEQRKIESGGYFRDSRFADNIRYDESEVVMETLASIADVKESVPLLRAALKQPDLKTAGLLTLCKLGPVAEDALPDIRHVLLPGADADDDYVWRLNVLLKQSDRGLHELGLKALPLLLELLDLPTFLAKNYALMEIVRLAPDPKSVVPKLKVLLEDKDPYVRLAVAGPLWKFEKNAAVVPVLIQLLSEQEVELVKSAVYTLRDIGPAAKEALPSLKAVLEKRGLYYELRIVVEALEPASKKSMEPSPNSRP
jgi:HEAT repeat protein